MYTKTVVHPVTHEEYVLVGCDACGSSGKYWRDDIGAWWPCHKCEGYGCLEIGKAQKFVPHPDRNYRDYKPVKGRA